MSEYHVVVVVGPSTAYHSIEGAKARAEQLAKEMPGSPVVIYKLIGTCVKNSVHWDWKEEDVK